MIAAQHIRDTLIAIKRIRYDKKAWDLYCPYCNRGGIPDVNGYHYAGTGKPQRECLNMRTGDSDEKG